MAAVALVAVATAVGVGTRVAGTRTLPALTRSGDSGNYARNAIGHLAPVDAKFVAKRVGKVRGAPTTTTTEPVRARPRPAATPPPDDSIHGSPGNFPGLTPGGWVLNLKMVTNSDTVRDGDEIHYRMIITNSGTEDFRGRSFLLEWHTPNGTLGRNALDECNILPIAVVQAICFSQRLQISAGLGEARHETFNSGGLVMIPAGESWTKDWFVQVLPSNAAGSTIFNHAHLTVTIDNKDTKVRTPDVVVRVVA